MSCRRPDPEQIRARVAEARRRAEELLRHLPGDADPVEMLGDMQAVAASLIGQTDKPTVSSLAETLIDARAEREQARAIAPAKRKARLQ